MSQHINSMLKKSFRLRQLLSAIRHRVDIAKTAKDGVESRHPQQVPHRLIGPRALLIAAELKHAMGVPYRKVAHSAQTTVWAFYHRWRLDTINAIVGKMVHSRISSDQASE